MSAASKQHELVRREFKRQSESFAAADSFFGSREIGRWIADRLPPLAADSEVLDLAGGAGHLSRALASRARRIVVLDLTPEQLEVGRRAVERERIDNVEFVEGDAARTPFGDQSFDLVVSRFALHHVPRPEVVIAEAGRLCRAGGHIALIDMVSPESEAAAAVFNALERVRDPSHTAALSAAALEALAAREGAIVSADRRQHEFAVEPWLQRAATPEGDQRKICDWLREELAGGEPTGMRPRETAAGLTVRQSWRLLVVRRRRG